MRRLKVLYCDNHLLFVHKPAGVLAQSDGTDRLDLLSMAKQHVVDRFHKPGAAWLGLVHRLDRPVSGVTCFARTSKAAGRVSEAIRDHAVVKDYVALVRGHWTQCGEVQLTVLPATKHGNTTVVGRHTAAGQLAALTVTPLLHVHTAPLTAVLVRLKTGRKHQIRAMLSHLGHPILGDRRYGDSSSCPGHVDRRANDEPVIALHAYRLQVPHPTKRAEVISVASSIPDDWSRWLSSQALSELSRTTDATLALGPGGVTHLHESGLTP
jgi:23S rRNA pseudouridine1911/1915/1917 synthase